VEIAESEDKDEVCAAVAANVLWQMESDRKSSSLQQFQGHMWREAYKTGAVQSE
jgi:methionine salvage enolase-phosphatase E1